MIDEEAAERIGIAVARAMQQARSVSDSEHFDHHQWISERINSEKARRRFYEALADHVAKWGAISIASAALYALYLGVRQVLKTAT